MSGFGDFEHAVVVNVFVNVAGDECLSDDRVPDLFGGVFSASEEFNGVVFVCADFFGFVSFEDVFYVVVSKILFSGENDFQYFDEI